MNLAGCRALRLPLIALLAGPLAASADTRHFTGSTNNDWSTATNWQENAVPGAGDRAIIPE